MPARPLPQPGRPLRDRRPLRVLAPRASLPGETPGPRRATWPFSARPPSRPYSGPPRPTSPLKFSFPLPAAALCPGWAPRLGWGRGGIAESPQVQRQRWRRVSPPPTVPSLDPSGRRPVRAAAASAAGLSAPSTARRSPVPRYLLQPWAPRLPDSLLGPCLGAGPRACGGLLSLQGEVIVQEPGSCCPSCHRETLGMEGGPGAPPALLSLPWAPRSHPGRPAFPKPAPTGMGRVRTPMLHVSQGTPAPGAQVYTLCCS